jgi:hypothetical protein
MFDSIVVCLLVSCSTSLHPVRESPWHAMLRREEDLSEKLHRQSEKLSNGIVLLHAQRARIDQKQHLDIVDLRIEQTLSSVENVLETIAILDNEYAQVRTDDAIAAALLERKRWQLSMASERGGCVRLTLERLRKRLSHEDSAQIARQSCQEIGEFDRDVSTILGLIYVDPDAQLVSRLRAIVFGQDGVSRFLERQRSGYYLDIENLVQPRANHKK